MMPDVTPGNGQSVSGPVKLRGVHLEYMPEIVVDLQRGFHVFLFGRLRQSTGVVEQNFLASDLNQQGGRQATQVTVDRRHQRVRQRHAVGIHFRGFEGPGSVQDRFTFRSVKILF